MDSNKDSLGGDAIKLTTSKVITLAISLVSVMLLSRFLTLDEYGTYSQILLVTNLMTSLLMLGLPNSINYFLARSETVEERQKFLSVYYSLNTILSIIVGLVLVCSTPLLVQYFDNPLLKNFIYFLAVFPWTKIIMSSIDNVLIVYKRVSLIMIYRVANGISLLLILLIVQICEWGFQTYMFLFILVETLFAISIYYIVKNISGKLIVTFDRAIIKKMLTFSIPIGLASVVGTLNIELDKLMIGNFLGTDKLAIYTNASRELPMTIVATSFTALLIPQLARLLKKGENQIAVDLWGYSMVLSFIIMCFLVTAVFVFATDVMNFLYSEKFLSGVSVFRVYCLLTLLRFTYFGMMLNAKGKTKFIFYSSIISLGLNIVLSYIMFKSIGFIGPAVATLLSQFIINMIQLVYTAKIIGVNFSKVFPWRSLGLITVVNFILGLLFYKVKIFIPLDSTIGSLFESIILGLLWALLYLSIFLRKIKKQWRALNKGE
ncbi:oligosaccharide flippase family protein [Bacillus sp. JJ634]